MRVVESFYTEKLGKIKKQYEKKVRGFNQQKGSYLNAMNERTELEKIFVNSLDEMRKQILKRRLKQEILLNNKQKTINTGKRFEEDSEEA